MAKTNSWDELRKELAEQDQLYRIKKYGAFGQMLNDVFKEVYKDKLSDLIPEGTKLFNRISKK